MKIIQFVLITLLMGSTTVLPRILYVKAGSTNPVAPYLSKETAADSINKATKICLPGDTVFVFNGTYGEKVLMNENTSLIGQSRDSTIIRPLGTSNGWPYFIINVWSNCIVKNFNLQGFDYQNYDGGIGGIDSVLIKVAKNVSIENVKMKLQWNIGICIHSGKVTNCQFYLVGAVISYIWPVSTFTDTAIINCENIEGYHVEQAIKFLYCQNQFVNFKNSFFSNERSLVISGQASSYNVGASFTNCIFLWGPRDPLNISVYARTIVESDLFLENCTFSGRSGVLFDYRYGKLRATNCLFSGKGSVLQMTNPGDVLFKYNFFSNYKIPSFMDSTNINGENSPPVYDWNTEGLFGGYRYLLPERRLDRYSQAIDKGDPSLQDADGSRSDMGVAGGPGGFSYVYPDLAPRIPDTVWVVKNNALNKYQYSWRMNSEPDFSYYKIFGASDGYIDCSSTLYLGETTTNSFELDFNRIPGVTPIINFVCYDTANNASVCVRYRVAPILVTSVEEGKQNANGTSSLNYVHPNPTKGLITIGYQLAVASTVTLSVFSTSGEEIAEVLCNEQRAAGTFKEQVQLRGASGIYLVNLTVVDEHGKKEMFTEKVSLMK